MKDSIVSYDVTEYVISYSEHSAGPDVSERFTRFDDAAERVKMLIALGGIVHQFYQLKKTAYKICEIQNQDLPTLHKKFIQSENFVSETSLVKLR